MKAWLKRFVPDFVLRAYHRRKRAQEARRNANRSPEEVFSEIYREGVWGGGPEPFYSGSGSSEETIVKPYVAAVKAFLRAYPSGKPAVVDLGCGDFSVGRQIVEDCASYTGVDVVPDLIRHHQETVADPRVKFLHLDIVRDELPPGDVCFVRQVFQHLSNDQISRVLAKLGRYQTVFVTEHYPHDAPGVVPNRDKVHGGGVRLFEQSGVYLDEPPFNVPRSDLELVLEVPGPSFGKLYGPTVIRTFRLTFSRPAGPAAAPDRRGATAAPGA